MEKTLSDIKLFTHCSSEFFALMQKQGKIKNFPKGQMLFFTGDEAEHFYFIKSGWVKLFRETLDGTQAIIDILTNNHVFGETAIFEEDCYPCSAEIVEDAQIAVLPLDVLKKEIETNNKLALDMLSTMARYRKQQDQEIEHRALQNAPQRIGCFLLRLTDQEEDGTATIKLPYDKMLVASRLGMQPETFSRALNKLKEKTGITIKGSTVEIKDIEQISEFSCAACSSEFPCKDLKTNK